MAIKLVYKVVKALSDTEFESAFVPEPLRLTYQLGRVTEPRFDASKLFVFDTLDQALAFKDFGWPADPEHMILEGQAGVVDFVSCVLGLWTVSLDQLVSTVVDHWRIVLGFLTMFLTGILLMHQMEHCLLIGLNQRG